MSALTICQRALKEIGEFEVPTSFVGNANLTAVQMLALVDRSGRTLARNHQWQRLTKEDTFTTTATEEQSSVLNADFWYFRSMTWWDRNNQWPLAGPATASQWQAFKGSQIQITAPYVFRQRGNSILFYPVPTAGLTIAYEYMSKYWVDTNADGLGEADAFAADTNTALIDEDLITLDVKWRFLKAKGLAYAEDLAEFEAARAMLFGRDADKRSVNLARRSRAPELPFLYPPEAGYGSA